jgi:ABC-type branched-chain amino acid transport systems, periplasmic component
VRYQTLTRALLIPVVGALTMTACANSDSNNTASGNDCVTGADIAAVAASGGGDSAATTAPATKPPATDTGKTYTIAFLGALSGNNPQLGINEANAVQLAVKQANESGTLPFTLKYTSSDDEGAPDKAPAAAQKLIDDKNVVAVVGPPFSGTTKAAEPALSDAGLLSISPSATNPTLTSEGFKTFFRVVPPDDAQGQEAAALLRKYAKSVYLVDDTSEYGKGLADVIERELGSSVKVTREGVSDKTQDYSSIAQKVKNANVDAMYYAGYYQGASLFAKSLKAVGYSCLAVSDDGTNDDQFIKGAQDAAEGWLFTCPCADARVDPKAKSFLDAYKAEFNTDPGTYSPESYDAANAIIAAMSTIDGDVTRDKVVEAVKSVDYAGLTKQVKFEPNGEVSGKTIFVYGVDGGKRILKGTTTDLLK